VGTLERHRTLEKTRMQAGKAVEKRDAATQELQKAEEALRDAQKRGLEIASERAQALGARDSLSSQLERAKRELAAIDAECAELARREERNRELLAKMRPDSERIDGEIASVAEQLATTRAQLGAKREEVQPLRKKNGQVNEQYTELRLEKGKLVEREAYANRMAQGHRGDIVRLEKLVERISREARGRVRIDEVDAIVDALTLVRETVIGRISAIEERADNLREGGAELHRQADEKRREALELRAEADDANARLSETRVEKGRLELQVEAAIATIRDDCATPLETALARPALADRVEAEERAATLRRRIANLGPINPDAANEYAELKERFDFLNTQVADITAARRALEKVERAIDERMKDDFANTFQAVGQNFQRIFADLFPGGSAELMLVEGEDPDQPGIEVNAQPRGKRIAKMSLMSGGEKSLTALALLFAVYATRPTPFYILDEVEAALDDTNLRRLCHYLEAMRDRTQLIMITHQRRTMEMADVLYGISMQSDGVTRVISQKLERDAK
jgi:chromosome segregation protein